MTNNTIGLAGNTAVFENLTVQAASGAANASSIVAKIENNTVARGGDGGLGGGFLVEAIRLSAGTSGANTVQLEQGSQTLATAVSTVLDANNPGAGAGAETGTGVSVNPPPDGGGKITVVVNGTVLAPVVP